MKIAPLEIYFSSFVKKLDDTGDSDVALAARLVSRKVSEGHICLNLGDVAGKKLEISDGQAITAPPLNEWLEKLRQSDVVGCSDEWQPLILDPPLLYLHRYWTYEKKLAHFIRSKLTEPPVALDNHKLQLGLDLLFPEQPVGPQRTAEDWQRKAAFAALTNFFCVISGGPGTGKTSTVVKILALYCQLHENSQNQIFLAAPTGKAAGRLQDSILAAKESLECPSYIKNSLPDSAVTIHRLLGLHRKGLIYNKENLLPADLVIVDEASMVDLSLMVKLISALPQQAVLLLLGDRHQLASVQPGSVLSDICLGLCDHDQRLQGEENEDGKRGASSCVVELKKSYRFDQKSGIGAVSRAVRDGDGKTALSVLYDEQYPDVLFYDTGKIDPRSFEQKLFAQIDGHYQNILRQNGPSDALDTMDEFAVICALRHGSTGSQSVNQLAVKHYTTKKEKGGFFHGQPILVTRNSYKKNLYNGDSGLLFTDPETQQLRVFFQGRQGVRKMLPSQLTEHETAFAFTVHKSQGSEFDHVVFVLPAEDTPLLCRELVYTALTRARKSVTIWGSPKVLLTALERDTQRSSGLVKALRS